MTRRFFASGSKLRGVLSQEDENLDPGSDGAAGTEEALATLAAEGEANEAEAEAAESEAMVDNAMDGVVALEELRMEIRAANQNGGLNRGGAAIARRHANFVLRHCMGTDGQVTMPSMESFGGTSNQISSGVLTMEGIGASMKTAWEAMLRMLKKVREKVMGWINKVFGAGENLVKRAEAILKREELLKGGKATEKVDGASLWKALAMGGELDGAKLVAGMTSVTKIADGMVDTSVKQNKAIEDSLESLEGTDKANVGANLAKAQGGLANFNSGVSFPVTDKAELPGNVRLRYPSAQSVGNADQRIEGFGLVSNEKPVKDSVDLNALTKDEIKSIATMAKKIGDSLVAGRKVGDKSKTVFDKYETFLKKQSTSPNVDDSTGAAGNTPADGYKKLISLSKEMLPLIDGPIKVFAGYVLRTGRSALDYCDASLGKYEST